MGSSLKPKNEVISPEETMRLLETQHRWNNPNVSNMFGDTVTTFGADGQPQITQTPSETMRGLIEQQQGFVGQGAPQLNLQRDQNADNMMNQFNSRVGQRAGFQPPPMSMDQMANLGQAPQQMPTHRLPPPQNQPSISMQDNAPDNGVPIGDGSMKPDFMEKMKRFGSHLSGQTEPENPLVKALMQYRRNR